MSAMIDSPGDPADRSAPLSGNRQEVSGEPGNQLVCEAARRGDEATLASLLDRGADPNGFWNDEVAQRRRTRIAQDMMDRFTPGEHLDRRAASDGPGGELIAELTASVTGGPPAGEIPLFCAARGGSPECVRLLVERGADVTVRDATGATSLWHAGSADAARALVDHGLSMGDQDKLGFTPLASAARCGGEHAPGVITALIEAGADVNGRLANGCTPVMCAIGFEERDPRILELLLARGADPLIETGDGDTLFHTAIVGRFDEDDATEEARSILRRVHVLGVDVNRPNHQGVSPLAEAIVNGSIAEIKTLIELGADVNASGPRNLWDPCQPAATEVPLVFLSMFGDDGDARLETMLEAGVDLEVADDQGRSPLEFARMLFAAAEADEDHTDALNTSYVAVSRCVELLEERA